MQRNLDDLSQEEITDLLEARRRMSGVGEARPRPAPVRPVPPPESPESEEPKDTDRIEMDSVGGSEIHIAHLEMLLQNTEAKRLQAVLDSLENKVSQVRDRLSLAMGRVQEKKTNLLRILSKNGLPDGWRFERLQDGKYVFFKPQASPGPNPPIG
jgi:hypothetical protein